MADFETQILAALVRKTYEPLKPKSLARKLGVPAKQYGDFRRALRELLRQGRAQMGKNYTVRPAHPHGAVTGIFRKTRTAFGFSRPHSIDGHAGPEIHTGQRNALDAATCQQ